MNRTIKFQLNNVKTSYLFSALISYGGLGLFWLVAYLLDPSILEGMTSQPFWLNALSVIIAPFTFLSIMYALFDGLMFFDTAIRFGVSRTSYFITQLVVYIILSLLLSFATGVTEVMWAGSVGNYFTAIGENYLSLGHIAGEFTDSLALAIMMLGIYRFKGKAFIPVVAVFGLALMVVSFAGATGNSAFIQVFVNAFVWFTNNQTIALGLIGALLIGVYYLFITKTEVQD